MKTTSIDKETQELIDDLTEKLVLKKKQEVFNFLYTLEPQRAAFIKDKLIQNLRVKQSTAAKTSPTKSEEGETESKSSEPSPTTGRKVPQFSRRQSRGRSATSPEALQTKKTGSFAKKRDSARRRSATSSNKQIGKYVLGTKLGSGAFGTVYQGLHSETGRFVAIKELDRALFTKESYSNLAHEAELLNKMDHVNIVRFIEMHETKKKLYFVMEFIEGGSLFKTLKKFGIFSESLAAKYVLQVLKGLSYLHKSEITHGDIKADNILLTKLGGVKLADFGTAALLQAKQEQAMGTPFWKFIFAWGTVAPEVIKMQGATPKADIWSVGCLAVELVNGVPPYYEMGAVSALYKMVEEDCPPIPEDLSDELVEFLKLCFIKDVHKRPSARQLLSHPWILANKGDQSIEEESGPAVTEPVRRKPRDSSTIGLESPAPNWTGRKAKEASEAALAEKSSDKASKRNGFSESVSVLAQQLDAELSSLKDVEEITYPNGDRYRGQIKEGLRHGRGLYTMKDGTSYRGEFVNNSPNGYGLYLYPNGDSYEGEFKDDLFHGKGKYISTSGMTYEGEYSEGKRQGKGKQKAPNGNTYEGDYSNNLMEGYGVYTYLCGDVYKGEFKKGKFHGKGVYVYGSTGAKIEGQFLEGKPATT